MTGQVDNSRILERLDKIEAADLETKITLVELKIILKQLVEYNKRCEELEKRVDAHDRNWRVVWKIGKWLLGGSALSFILALASVLDWVP